MDWNDNGHDDYDDGFLDAVFYLGPGWLSFLMLVAFCVWYLYRHWPS